MQRLQLPAIYHENAGFEEKKVKQNCFGDGKGLPFWKQESID